jgi:hypothetical protein
MGKDETALSVAGSLETFIAALPVQLDEVGHSGYSGPISITGPTAPLCLLWRRLLPAFGKPTKACFEFLHLHTRQRATPGVQAFSTDRDTEGRCDWFSDEPIPVAAVTSAV